MLQTLFTLILALLGFGILILVHETGHCVVAKLCGVRVNEFWIGMGPTLLSKKIGETRYALKLLPIGGACVMEGEDGYYEDDNPRIHGSEQGRAWHSSRAFPQAKRWKRFLILIAGVTMNFLIGYFIMFLYPVLCIRFF